MSTTKKATDKKATAAALKMPPPPVSVCVQYHPNGYEHLPGGKACYPAIVSDVNADDDSVTLCVFVEGEQKHRTAVCQADAKDGQAFWASPDISAFVQGIAAQLMQQQEDTPTPPAGDNGAGDNGPEDKK